MQFNTYKISVNLNFSTEFFGMRLFSLFSGILGKYVFEINLTAIRWAIPIYKVSNRTWIELPPSSCSPNKSIHAIIYLRKTSLSSYTLHSFITLQCVPIPGLGFRRGSYKCVCKHGFYFPDTLAEKKYYNGTLIEEEYERLMIVSIKLIIYFI